jgi:hypothetical protein
MKKHVQLTTFPNIQIEARSSLTDADALAPKAYVMAVKITLLPPVSKARGVPVRQGQMGRNVLSSLTSIVSNDKVDLRIELDFHVRMAHKVLETAGAQRLR